MSYSIYEKKLVFCWGTSPTDLYGRLDITQVYRDLGGSISPKTEVKFSSTFPIATYSKTALTNKMRDEYQCAGSLTAAIYNPGKPIDYLSLSDYFDLTMHDPDFGDHHNLYLQYQMQNQKPGHTEKYMKQEDRHIELKEKLFVTAYIDGKKVYEDYIRANLP